MNSFRIPKKLTFFKQVLIGAVGAIVDLIILLVLSNFLLFELSFLIGITIAILINYILTINYSFKSLNKITTKKKELFFYYISYCTTIIIQFLVIYGLQKLNYDLLISKLVAISLAFAITFSLKFYFIFGQDSEK